MLLLLLLRAEVVARVYPAVPDTPLPLMPARDVRNTCKHSGAVLPLPSAPVGRGVDGIDAMA
jgi:hypothetical protein